MKERTLRVGCTACALILMITSFPIDGLARPMETTEIQQETEAATDEITEAEIDAYFDNSVFVGDSVLQGFRNYAMARSDTWLGRLQFLASVSFSTYNALRPVTSKSLHPVYQGEKRLVEDSIALMGAKKVFLFFGLNDINITGIEGTCANYIELVNRIKAKSPDIEVHLMSMTYTVRGKSKGNLYNDNVRRYNEAMKNLAIAQGWGFVDVANPLADENGDLRSSYSSDNYVHLKNAAYDVWSVVLRAYAKANLEVIREILKAANSETAGAGESGPGVAASGAAAGPDIMGGPDALNGPGVAVQETDAAAQAGADLEGTGAEAAAQIPAGPGVMTVQ